MRFLILVIFLFPLSLKAQTVSYAFQNVKDKNRMAFIKSNARNRIILYISEKCTTCMASLEKRKQDIIKKQITVVISTNNINRLKSLVKKNAPSMSGFIYADPARRFEKDLKLNGSSFTYVLFNEGKYRKQESQRSIVTPPPTVYRGG